ncbi:MAG: hypothetical protein K8R88_04280, partial [Armatimonadetes bacterium]|nr:hypothetical protein [Armatimonadota bacterium]
ENRSNPYGVSEGWGPITYRAIASPEPEHTLYFVERMGNWWPAIAWTISGFSAVLAVFPFVLLARYGSQYGVKGGTPQGALRDMFVATEYKLAFGLCLFLLLLTTVWAVLDVLDRGRRDFVWVIALFLFAIPCCGIASLSWVIIPLYMQFGRKK